MKPLKLGSKMKVIPLGEDGKSLPPEVLYPDVIVQLTGQDGNAFQIIGSVRLALKRAGYREAADTFSSAAMNAESYDALLQLTMRTVSVE